MRLKPLLAASLVLNVLLAAGLYHKTPAERAYYLRPLLGVPTPKPPPTPHPDEAILAEPPPRVPAFSKARLAEGRLTHAYRQERGAAFGRWRESGRGALSRLLGYAPSPFGGETRLVARREFPTYTREELYLRSARGLWLRAFLLLPKREGKHPAVLALPGHDNPGGYGAAAVAGKLVGPRNYQHSFGQRLAERGYVVLSLDVAGIGELRYLKYEDLVNQGLLVGEPLKRVMLEEVHEAMDYLLSRPEVDSRRVGTAGVSLGGELAMFAAVLDPRVTFAAVSGFVYSYRDYGGGNMPSLYIPGILHLADIPDLAGMVAPRPMLIQTGRRDVLFDFATAVAHVEKVEQAYEGAGAAHALTFAPHDLGHEMDVDGLLAWLDRVVPAGVAR